jgi:hypothetical protein
MRLGGDLVEHFHVGERQLVEQNSLPARRAESPVHCSFFAQDGVVDPGAFKISAKAWAVFWARRRLPGRSPPTTGSRVRGFLDGRDVQPSAHFMRSAAARSRG